MKLSLDKSALRTLLRDRNGPVQRHTSRLAYHTAQRAAQLAPKGKTLQLSSRIQVDTFAGPEPGYKVGVVDVPYSMAVHEGSKPHIIRARNKAALHFFWTRTGFETIVPSQGGFRTHITKGGILMIGKGYVEHPGTAPNRFLLQALEEVVGRGV